MLHRVSTHVIAFTLGTLALSTLQAAQASLAVAPAPVPQSPTTPLPDLDADAWRAWLRAELAACASDGACSSGGGTISQAEFDALLAASPSYANHNHAFGFSLERPQALDGVQVNGVTGTPQ